MTPMDMTYNLAMYTWRPAKINYNVVDVGEDAYVADRAIAELSKRHAVNEVRRAVNAWYYENEPSELD